MSKKRIYTYLLVTLVLAVMAAIFWGTAYLIQFKFDVYLGNLGKDKILSYLLAGLVWSILIPFSIFAYAFYATLTGKPLPEASTSSTNDAVCDCPCIVICL